MPIMTMSTTHLSKLFVVLAGAAVAAGSAALALQEVQARTAAAPQQEGGQPAPQQEPEEFRLTQRERIGQDGSLVRVGDTQMIFDAYINFTDSVNDLFVWGYIPTISGQISDNAVLGGYRIEITPEAEVGGDLFIFAQGGRINGHVGGDIYAFVADLTIGQGSVVDGAVYGSSGNLTIDGDVAGPVSYAGGVVTINGTVRGDLRLETGELEIGPDAVIMGELRYESPREASIEPGADVQGEVRYFAPRDDEDDEDAESSASSGGVSFWSILWDAWWLLSSFLVGAIALAIGGEASRRPARRLLEQPALGLGFGFVIAVVIPAAAILAMVLLVTIPLGFITLAVYVAAAYLARLVASMAVGHALLRLARGGKDTSAYASLAVGLVLFFFLTQIPYIGFLIWLAAIVAGLGGIFLASRKATVDRGVTAPAVT